METTKFLATVALASMIGLFQASSAEAKNEAYKELNRQAVQMWLQQQANQGIVYPDPYTAMQALRSQQLYGAPNYGGYYGPVYSPYYWRY